MSGKEAMVFVVRCGDETRCAKVYKEANNRSFRQAACCARACRSHSAAVPSICCGR
jgi:hypothetical protein